MNIEAMRLWAKHDQGHASTYLSLEDARLVVEAYDALKTYAEGDWSYVASEAEDIVRRMEGD